MQRMQWASAPPGSPPGQGGSHRGRQGKRTDSGRGATALGKVAEPSANQPGRPVSNQALLPESK